MEVHARATAAHDVAASGLPSRLVPGLPSCSPLAPFRDFCLKCLYEATLGHSRFQQARFAVDARSNHRSLRTKCERHQCAPHPTIWQGNSCLLDRSPLERCHPKRKPPQNISPFSCMSNKQTSSHQDRSARTVIGYLPPQATDIGHISQVSVAIMALIIPGVGAADLERTVGSVSGHGSGLIWRRATSYLSCLS